MYLEFQTQEEAMERAAQAAQALGYGEHTKYAGSVRHTNGDTFVWGITGPLTDSEIARLVETYEPKAWEDLI